VSGFFLRDLAGIILGCGTYVQADGPDMAPQSFHEVGPKAIIPPKGFPTPTRTTLPFRMSYHDVFTAETRC